MAQRFVSGRGLARLDGCAPGTVAKAVNTGVIAPNGRGTFDTQDPRIIEWLRRVKRPDRLAAVATESRLETINARLQGREFEAWILAGFYIDRLAMARALHDTADILMAALQRFPTPDMLPVLWPDADAHERFALVAKAAMRRHLAELFSDTHDDIEKRLDDAASLWRRYKAEPKKGTRPPSFMPAATLADASRRYAAAVATIEATRIKVRTGSLLALPAADFAGVGLMIDWRNACLEMFGVRQNPTMLVDMGRSATDAEQSVLFKTVGVAMRRLLHDVHDGAKAIWPNDPPLRAGVMPG